ncbi:MAG: hypothetical protein H8E18_14920 [FCB group bacterium]|uniref:CheD n=1 Tax=Chlorobium phaeobacteroides (strain BS1) TaxID=331678 RepID=B3ENC4_CHLPB|nr:hypothetical protein [FCB group bacterium]
MNINKLLKYFWSYPNPETSRASWAVKENLVLKGKLKEAEENPGMGLALLSTELAMKVFGKTASRKKVEGCISWAASRYPVEQPVNTSAPEFSQRLAFGIVQLRAGSVLPSFNSFMESAFNISENGWFLDECTKKTSVFTVLYAAEILDLYAPKVLETKKKGVYIGRKESVLSWLYAQNRGMWGTGGIFPGAELLDKLVTSAWIMVRLTNFAALPQTKWPILLQETMINMLDGAAKSETWLGVDPALRFRIEARVAAAASMFIQKYTGHHSIDFAEKYLDDWKVRREANDLDESKYDLATVIAVLQGLLPYKEMASLPVVSSLVSYTD